MLPASTPAGRQPHASKHALPAPSILAKQPDTVDEATEQAAPADIPGKAATQSPAVSEHEPSQPDEAAVLKCQVSISAFPSPATTHHQDMALSSAIVDPFQASSDTV